MVLRRKGRLVVDASNQRQSHISKALKLTRIPDLIPVGDVLGRQVNAFGTGSFVVGEDGRVEGVAYRSFCHLLAQGGLGIGYHSRRKRFDNEFASPPHMKGGRLTGISKNVGNVYKPHLTFWRVYKTQRLGNPKFVLVYRNPWAALDRLPVPHRANLFFQNSVLFAGGVSQSAQGIELLNGVFGQFLRGISLILGLNRQLMSILPAINDRVKRYAASYSQYDGEDSNPYSGSGGSLSSFILGALFFVAGWWAMRFSFYFADRPYGTNNWRSRLRYIACGVCSVLFLWQGINLTFKFSIAPLRFARYRIVVAPPP